MCQSKLRHIDTAYHYQNEDAVGRAVNYCIDQGLVTRADLYITTKLADHHKLPAWPKRAIETQLKALNLDYIDLYLIHSPWSLEPSDDCWTNPDRSKWSKVENDLPVMADVDPVQTWKELEDFVDKGWVKSLGVSNFSENQIDEILKVCKHRPQMNQVECTPLFSQAPLLEYCTKIEMITSEY